jgi:acyl carrier protein
VNTSEILGKLQILFEKIFDDDVVVTAKTSAVNIPEWDSLTHIRLILSVEKAFGVKFSAAEVSSFKDVGDLMDLIAVRA